MQPCSHPGVPMRSMAGMPWQSRIIRLQARLQGKGMVLSAGAPERRSLPVAAHLSPGPAQMLAALTTE